MKIGILETGPVGETLAEPFGNYAQMFTVFLRRADPEIDTERYVVHEDEFPGSVNDADGWLVTGSKFGVYEDHPWIPPLEDFIRDIVAAKIPLSGFCFGHQIIAQALGGQVEKSEKGWGLGVQDYDLHSAPDWIDQPRDGFSATAIHQDQVIAAPEGAHILASSEFCPHAALAYGDKNAPLVITSQPHPEFEPDFVAALLETRMGKVFPTDLTENAQASLDQSTNNRDWSRWVVDFYRNATKKGA